MTGHIPGAPDDSESIAELLSSLEGSPLDADPLERGDSIGDGGIESISIDDALSPAQLAEEERAIAAEYLSVEAELDTRWPETRLEPSLERISALLDLLGSPQLAYPAIQVAGTNGKTSTARMIDALLRAHHRRTGRTTSPHLQLATERISIDGHPISPEQYIHTWRDIEPFVDMIDRNSDDKGEPRLSKFEVLIAMSYAAFAEAPVDVAVVEVGMGGTWDATNVITADVAVICPIGLDHTEYLGTTIAEIAGEKAGIIKRAPVREHDPDPHDTIAVIGPQEPAAMEVILRAAVAADAVVARQNSEFAVAARQVAVGGQLLNLQGLAGSYDEIFLPLHGAHQAENAALALAAVEAFFGAGPGNPLDLETVRAGFAEVTSPGRMERLRAAPAIFVDAAHNPHGAAALARTLQSEFDFRKLVGVVSVFSDKDAAGLLSTLEPVFDHLVVTHNGSERAMEVDELIELAESIYGEERVTRTLTLEDAIENAIGIVEADGEQLGGTGIVVTGSVVTAGAARALLGGVPQ